MAAILKSSYPKVLPSSAPSHKDGNANIQETLQGSRRVRTRRSTLQVRDESAIRRRRAQNRMAQRAYRHRKNSAIITLQEKVAELEKIKAAMVSEFLKLYNLVVAESLMESSPEVRSRLKAIADIVFRCSIVPDECSNFSSPQDNRCCRNVSGLHREEEEAIGLPENDQYFSAWSFMPSEMAAVGVTDYQSSHYTLSAQLSQIPDISSCSSFSLYNN